MAQAGFRTEYICIKGGSGRLYTQYQSAANKQPCNGFGCLYPEGYTRRIGHEQPWPCPIIDCGNAFKHRKDLGAHFSTDHKGATLHDLRNGQFRLCGYETNRPTCVRSRSNNPPSPILPPVPPSSPTSSAMRSSSVDRGVTPGLYIKQEHDVIWETGQCPDLIIIDDEHDQHVANTRDVSDGEDQPNTNDEEDIDDVFSDSSRADESITSVSDNEDVPDNNIGAQTPGRKGQYFDYAGSAVWRHINQFTPERLPVPEDTCLREFLTLPLARKLPRCWHVLLGNHQFIKQLFDLKAMTSTANYLTGEETDERACTKFGCLSRHPEETAQALIDFASNSEAFHNVFAFPRCIFPPKDFLERSVALKERLGGITCCNAYYLNGKKAEPKLIYVAGYPLPYPITPENFPRDAPAPGPRDINITPTSGQPEQDIFNGFPQSSPLKSRSTSQSLKRKTPPSAAFDYYRLSSDSATPAKWESLTGILHQGECLSGPAIAYSPEYIRLKAQTSPLNSHEYCNSGTEIHTEARKRVKLLSSLSSNTSDGSTSVDFRIIHLKHVYKPVDSDGHHSKQVYSVSLPVTETGLYLCSVARGGPVRVCLDKEEGEGQEKPLDITEDGVWPVKKGWGCRMEIAVGSHAGPGEDVDIGLKQGMEVAASVHVHSVLESGKDKDKEKYIPMERFGENKQQKRKIKKAEKKERAIRKAFKTQHKKDKEQRRMVEAEKCKERQVKRQAVLAKKLSKKLAKQEKRKEKEIGDAANEDKDKDKHVKKEIKNEGDKNKKKKKKVEQKQEENGE